jgi:hypothetical protein
MMQNLRFLLLAGIVATSVLAVAEVKFIQSKSGAIVDVATSEVEATCGKNFVFRELKKEEAPAYLQKEIIKAAFKGEMAPSIDALVGSLKANNGKCAWVTPEELPKAK